MSGRRNRRRARARTVRQAWAGYFDDPILWCDDDHDTPAAPTPPAPSAGRRAGPAGP